jgi:3',5'-cyclic AMP phosphodiesterase CpdA
VAAPYIQLGNNPTYGKTDNLELLWISKDSKSNWSVELERAGENTWKSCPSVKKREIQQNADGDKLFSCSLKDLPTGKAFKYRVLRNSQSLFEASSQARKGKTEPYHFNVFGDMGAGTDGQKRLANKCFQLNPDFIVFPGDLVYRMGRYSEYLNNYFPVYNANNSDKAKDSNNASNSNAANDSTNAKDSGALSNLSNNQGVPLLASVLTIGVLGNHDIATTRFFTPANLDKTPDALAYYYLWSEPLNGPTRENTLGATPIAGQQLLQDSFKKAAGENFPVMANFSFDYGNSHWLVLDGNYYSDWSDPKLRKWVADDLHKARKFTWRFVTFHQPGFSTDSQHANEQRMRMLSDIFQNENVDIVFSGHAHDYQRSFPIVFQPALKDGHPYLNPDGTVGGTIVKDLKFDGSKYTKPKGIIYIVTGAGGAELYKSLPGAKIGKTLDFTNKFDSEHYSLSDCTIDGNKFELKQISAEGELLDQFTIMK